MNQKIKKITAMMLSLLICYVFMSGQKITEINTDESPRWNTDPRTSMSLYPSGTFPQLPQSENESFQFSNEPRKVETPSGEIQISPNFRVHPRSSPSTQSEVILVRHPSNPLIMYGSANTYQGENFCTGTYVTTNGGINWYGNDTLLNTSGAPFFNYGDPGPVIDKDGRFLISYITLVGLIGASYSTNNGLNFSSTFSFPGSSSSSEKLIRN